MTWVLVILAGLAAFALMALVLRLPRNGWEITGAALLFGLAGYALQGHPALPGAPHPPAEDARAADAELVRQRQAMGSAFGKGQSWMILADGLARQGQFRAAAEVLGKAVAQDPNDADVWVALGNALVEHSSGMITPAAQYAFQKAARIAPDHPGPPFFMGLSLAQSGRLADARTIWGELLARSPADAPWRSDLEARLARLDSMLAATGQAVPGTPPAMPPMPPAGPSAGASATP